MNSTAPEFCIPLSPIGAPTDPGYVVFPASHWLYQMANVLLLISYVAPSLLALRVILAMASLCYSLWGALILRISVDTTVWNAIFVLINLGQAGWIVYNMRPIHFDPEFEQVYSEIFGPGKYNLPKIDFLPLAKAGYVRKIKKGRYYCHDDDDCNQLSVLISGSLYVTKRVGDQKLPILIGIDEPVCFIDSPEWLNQKKSVFGENIGAPEPANEEVPASPSSESREDDTQSKEDLEKGIKLPFFGKKKKKTSLLQPQKYNVSIKAREDSIYVCWQYETLSKILPKTPSLIGALDAVVGYDVYKKLIRAQELHIADTGLGDRTQDTTEKQDSKQAKVRINKMLATFQRGKESQRSLLAPGNVPSQILSPQLSAGVRDAAGVDYSMEHEDSYSMEQTFDELDQSKDEKVLEVLHRRPELARPAIPIMSPRSGGRGDVDVTPKASVPASENPSPRKGGKGKSTGKKKVSIPEEPEEAKDEPEKQKLAEAAPIRAPETREPHTMIQSPISDTSSDKSGRYSGGHKRRHSYSSSRSSRDNTSGSESS